MQRSRIGRKVLTRGHGILLKSSKSTLRSAIGRECFSMPPPFPQDRGWEIPGLTGVRAIAVSVFVPGGAEPRLAAAGPIASAEALGGSHDVKHGVRSTRVRLEYTPKS